MAIPAEVTTLLLTQTGTVYTRAVRGPFNVVARTALACRLLHLNVQPAASGAERATLSAIRNMVWEASYYMPEGAQIEVEGVRWQTVRGTFAALPGPFGEDAFRRCDVERVTAPV